MTADSRPHDDRQERQRTYAARYPVHIGVDAAKRFHAVVARGPAGVVLERSRVYVHREGFAGIVRELQETFPGIGPAEMLVGIEFAGHHGATFAHFLRRHGFEVHSVLAMSTKKSREAALNSRLKSDLRDARQICTLVRDGVFVRYPDLRHDIAVCKQLAMRRHRQGVERARLINRVRGTLDLLWPEFEGHFTDLDHVTPQALLQQWPNPAKLVAAKRKARRVITEVSRGQHDAAWIDTFLASAAATVGVTDCLPEREGELQATLARWAFLSEQIAATDALLVQAVDQCPEATLLRSFPGVSALCAAAIIGELGDPADFRHPNQVLKLAGLNATNEQSGEGVGVVRISKRGRPLLRRQLYLLAGRTVQRGGPYAAEGARLKDGGRRGTERCVIIARKLVPVLFRILKTGQPFSQEIFDANRRRRDPQVA